MNTEKIMPWIMWAIATLFVLFQFILQISASVMTKPLMQDFHINHLGVSNLSASFFYTYLILQIPAGLLFDRFGPRKMLTMAALFLSAGCLCFATAHLLIVAILGRVLMGTGSTFAFVGMLFLLSEWFHSKHFALMVGLSEMLGMLLTASGVIGLAWLIGHTGWRLAVGGSGIVAFALAIVVFIIIRDHPSNKKIKTKHKKPIRAQLKRVSKNKQVWLSGLYGFCTFGVMNVIGALWGVPFLVNSYGYSLSGAAATGSLVIVGIAIGGPTIGWLSNKIQRRKPLMIITVAIDLALACCLVFIPHLPTPDLDIILLLLGVFCTGYILSFGVSRENSQPTVRGTALAMTNMILMFGVPILQPLVGWLIHNQAFGFAHNDAETFRYALIVVPITLAIGVVISLFIKETHCQNKYEIRI